MNHSSEIANSPWIDLVKYFLCCIGGFVFWIIVYLLPPVRANAIAFSVLNVSLLFLLLPFFLLLLSAYLFLAHKPRAADLCLVPAIAIGELLNFIPANPFALVLPYLQIMESSLLCELGNFKRAEYFARRPIAIFAGNTAVHPTLKLWALSGLTSALHGQGRYSETKELVSSMFEIVDSNQSSDASRATALIEFCSNLLKMGRTADAIEYGYKATAILSSERDPDALSELARALGHLGIAYEQSGDHQRSLELYQKSLILRTQMHGPDSIHNVYSYNNVGCALTELARYDEATEKLEKARQIVIDFDQKNSRVWSNVLASIGNLHRATGKLQDSERELLEALSLRQKRYKEEVHNCHHELGKLYRDKEEWEKSCSFFEKALTAREKRFGEHPVTASTLKEFAKLMRAMNKVSEAELFEQRVDRISSASSTTP